MPVKPSHFERLWQICEQSNLELVIELVQAKDRSHPVLTVRFPKSKKDIESVLVSPDSSIEKAAQEMIEELSKEGDSA